METTKQTMQPRKKFAFRHRPTGASITNHSQTHTITSSTTNTSSTNESSSSSSSSATRYDEDEHTIENLSNQTIYLPCGYFTAQATEELIKLDEQINNLSISASTTATNNSNTLSIPLELSTARRRAAAAAAGKDIRLLNLTNCTVIILDPLKALRVDGLTNCQVYTGPIAGSALLHRCESCIFMFAARQLRIHTSTLCDYYLHVMSHPIIEHCQKVRFAPYGLKYTNSDQILDKAGLLTPPRPDMWKNVDDFGWHRVQKSPNWDIIPYADRIGNQTSQEHKGISKILIEKQITIQYNINTGEDINKEDQPINTGESTGNKNTSTVIDTSNSTKTVMGNNSTDVNSNNNKTETNPVVADDDEL